MMSEKERQDKQKHRSHMSFLRTKIKAGKATQLEKAEVDKWDQTKSPRGRKNGEPLGRVESKVADSKPEVFSTLPGMGSSSDSLPPLNVAPGFMAGQIPPPSAGPSTSASNAAGHVPSSNTAGTANSHASGASQNKAPAMNAAEADASGRMIADIITGALRTANDYATTSGFMPLPEQFFTMFHFSVKRLSIKYGGAMDEDTFDACVIAGSGGYVGVNAFRTYKTKKEQELWEKSAPKVQSSPQNNEATAPINEKVGKVNGPVPRDVPGNPISQAGALVPFSAGAGNYGKGFDEKGVF